MNLLFAQPNNNFGNNEAALGAFFICYLAVVIAILAFFVVCYCKIAGKAGYSPWLGLLVIVPFGLLILLGILAFSQWPIEEGRRPSRRRRDEDDYDDDYDDRDRDRPRRRRDED